MALADTSEHFKYEHYKSKIELAARLLKSGGTIRVRAVGTSMLPALWPGDTLIVEGCGAADISPGEIVFVAGENRVLIHRSMRRAGNTWITRGDCVPQEDAPVAGGQIIGRVLRVHRYGCDFAPECGRSLMARFLSGIFCRFDHLRGLALRIHSFRQHRGNREKFNDGIAVQPGHLNL